MLTKKMLKALLSDYGVSVHEWGKKEAKTIHDLMKEIREGEAELKITAAGITRVTEIVKMMIAHPDRPGMLLLEFGQYFPDGRYRERKQFPAGKKKLGEDIQGCLVREIKEELGLEITAYEVQNLGSGLRETRDSRSYPGLPCEYAVHQARVMLKRNASEFLVDEFHVSEKDGTRQVFKWVAE